MRRPHVKQVKAHRLRIAIVGLSVALSLVAAGCGHDSNAGRSPAPRPTSPSASSASPTPKPSPKPTPKQKPTPKPSPTAATYDPLTGGKKVGGPVVGVKIDNVVQARPQAGVYLADMVVVERVEGNLTRLLAIYHTHWPKRIGPVRSARNTDIGFLPMFSKHPGLVFSGANAKVMRRLRKSPIRMIPRSTRDYSRVAPHNVFVNLNRIRKLSGIGGQRSVGFAFGSSHLKPAPGARSVTIPIGVDRFGFRYTHDHYRGTWNGRKQTDENGKPVIIDNIVDLKVRYRHDTHTTSEKSDVARTVGKGRVVVYTRGRKITGTWQRKSTSGPMTLETPAGKKIMLAPGHTWIMLDG